MADEIRMTLAEAQALECNRCGDCCDSRRAYSNGHEYFGWGRREPADADLIVTLREVHRGYFEEAVGQTEARHASDINTLFMCRALELQPDGTTLCGRHDGERPDRCGSWPVFGGHAEDIAQAVAAGRQQRLGAPARCTWANVVIVG